MSRVLECDSINDIDSKTISLILSTIDTTICSNQPLFVNGNQVFTSGTYFNEYTTINGCDSLIEIYNVTVNPIVQNSISLIDCDSSIVNNQTFYTSGQYNQVLVNQYGCDSLLEINLTINNSNFISEKITACDTFVWNNLTINSTGIYNYTFQNQNGCDSIRQIDLYFVPPYDLPISNFTINPTIVTYPNGEIILSNLSENAVNYYWFFSDNNLTSSNFELSHQYNQVGDFYIQLITENEDGCRDTTIQEITIYDDLILYVPNTFTPDGNECNNVFTPVFSAPNLVDKYNLSIYNRWGELIFESNDKNIGWDGFYNLQLCKSDVYTWKIIYSSFFTNEKKSLNGHFNLLK
jgi:gliding motility-associated-like protein